MTPQGLDLSPQLVQLCRLIGSVVGCAPVSAPIVDDDLARFARKRHRVGPLLHQAVLQSGGVVSPAAQEALHRDRQGNERKQLVSALLLQGVARWFSKNDIPWTLVKGLGLARQLYSDPALRPSADIDLLVSPEDFRRAIQVLEANGFRNVTGRPRTAILKAAADYLFRDVTLLGPMGPKIELHQRPLFVDGRRNHLAPLAPAKGSEPFPVPALDSDLAHYLLAHGAISYWARLKWLVDLVPLLASLDDAEKRQLMAKSRKAQTTASVCASLILLQALFPDAALGPLAPWMEAGRRKTKVTRRLSRYVRAIGIAEVSGQTPLSSRFESLEAGMMFSEAVSPRIRAMVLGPASSFLRAMATA